MTIFIANAENTKLWDVSFSCPDTGKLNKIDGKCWSTELLLGPVLTIAKEEDKQKAKRVLQKAEKASLITNSIKSETRMIPKILINKEMAI